MVALFISNPSSGVGEETRGEERREVNSKLAHLASNQVMKKKKVWLSAPSDLTYYDFEVPNPKLLCIYIKAARLPK